MGDLPLRREGNSKATPAQQRKGRGCPAELLMKDTGNVIRRIFFFFRIILMRTTANIMWRLPVMLE